MTTLLFYKPYDVVTRFTDDDGAVTLAAFIDVPNVYPAGRLDKDSEGLLILTDDGRLAHRITDPKHHLPKVYLAQVERVPDGAAIDALRRGVVIGGRKTRPAEVELLESEPDLPPRSTAIRFRKSVPTAWLRLTISEGMNRQVRRMTAAVGHPTLRLVRIAEGGLTLEGLAPGEWRVVTRDEIHQISHATASH
jgi:23S rRNA pseudouridine2457 synthase